MKATILVILGVIAAVVITIISIDPGRGSNEAIAQPSRANRSDRNERVYVGFSDDCTIGHNHAADIPADGLFHAANIPFPGHPIDAAWYAPLDNIDDLDAFDHIEVRPTGSRHGVEVMAKPSGTQGAALLRLRIYYLWAE